MSFDFKPFDGSATVKSHVVSSASNITDLAEPEESPSSPWFFKKRKAVDPDSIATPRASLIIQKLHRALDLSRREGGVRKIDWKIFSWVLVVFFALNLDRGNLGNALADNLLDDINISTNDYNNAQNMYRIGFLVVEIPSQMIGKKFGPDRWLPIQVILWSIASAGQFWMQNKAQFFACRFLIGIFMGGFILDAVLYLSYFYKKNEMPMRLAFFWFVDSMSGVVASFIAYGVLHMRGVTGRAGWRWLFLVEALITVIIGILSFVFMVPGPTQTKSGWFPKGFFSEREQKIIVNRVLRDDPSKGDMHNREAITLPMLWRSLEDYDLWPVYAIGMLFEIPAAPPKAYLSLSVKAIGFTTFQTTLLGIPITVFAALNMLWVTYLTEMFHQIAIFGLLAQIWILPLLVIEYTSAGSLSNWGQYALLFFILGQPSIHAAQVGWCSRLSNTVRTRAVSACLYNIAIQFSGIASSNIYRKDDKPLYRRGNMDLIAITLGTFVVYGLAKAYYLLRNRQKEAKWNALSQEQQLEYLGKHGDLGNKRLDFRFES